MSSEKSLQKQALFLLGIFLAVFLGGVGAVTYPNWYQSLPFKDFVPGFLRPAEKGETVVSSDQKVIRTVEESAVIDVVEKASPAVVSILADTVEFDLNRGPVQSQQGIGTGFIIDPSGIILTNNHVVSDRTIKYTVLTKDNKKFSVKKIDSDPGNDFAIIKIDAKNLPALKLGDSDSLGVVSGIGRGVTASDSLGVSQETLENVIQTDAALNPGNSGGPLLDLSGNVVGINFAVSQAAENIGFVIPVNRVKPIISQYQKTAKFIPTTLPERSSRGPPEFPGLRA